MSVDVKISEPFEHKGAVGVRVDLAVHQAQWHGYYHFHTHGMTPSQVKTERDRLVDRHVAIADTITRLQRLNDDVGSDVFVTDATLSPLGQNDVQLQVAYIRGDSRKELRIIYPTPAEVPANEEILRMINAPTNIDLADRGDEHARHIRSALQIGE